MPGDLRTILSLELPVIVRIGECSMPIDDVIALGPGAILELNKSSEDELDLMVNNRRIGAGTAVKVGENFGIQVTKIDPPRQRVAAMGGVDQ
jgi:flagellar motor switch protein FliN/FliY